MKNTKVLAITCALAAVMIAGTSLSVYAAEAATAPSAQSSASAQQKSQTDAESSANSKSKDQQKSGSDSRSKDSGEENGNACDGTQTKRKRHSRRKPTDANRTEGTEKVRPEKKSTDSTDGTNTDGSAESRKRKHGRKRMHKNADGTVTKPTPTEKKEGSAAENSQTKPAAENSASQTSAV